MPRPVALANSVDHLNIRVPKDLAATLRGANVTLPIDGKDITVKIGDKVIASLRTKDVREAKVRSKQAAAALDVFFSAMRTSPKVLSHKQIVALSGDAYRAFVARREDVIGAGDFDRAREEHESEVRSWMSADNADSLRLAREDAEFFASISLPDGPALLAWTRGGIDTCTFKMSEEEALETPFGRDADRVIAKQGLRLDPATRIRLLKQIGHDQIRGTSRLKAIADGDFSPDQNLVRFPDFQSLEPITVADLFVRWTAHNADKKEKSTIRRYTPTLNSLATFLKGKDIRTVEQDDIWSWAEHRRDADGIAARTVNRNDLVAVSSVFAFAMTRDGKRLRGDNPVKGVKLDVPKERTLRERSFRSAEIKTILSLARSVTIGGSYPKAAASRRWVPWICAYLGARV